MFEYKSVSFVTNSEPAASVDVSALQSRIALIQNHPRDDTKFLATHSVFSHVLPEKSLRVGAVYSVDKSLSLVMGLIAGPSAAGAWCAVVGIPHFGVEAAHDFGINLERLVLVPSPGDQWLRVAAALSDVMPLVVVRPERRVSDGHRAKFEARLRSKESTVIVYGEWPQSTTSFRVSSSRCEGIESGYGYLAERHLDVAVTSRSRGQRHHSFTIPRSGASLETSGHSAPVSALRAQR